MNQRNVNINIHVHIVYVYYQLKLNELGLDRRAEGECAGDADGIFYCVVVFFSCLISFNGFPELEWNLTEDWDWKDDDDGEWVAMMVSEWRWWWWAFCHGTKLLTQSND